MDRDLSSHSNIATLNAKIQVLMSEMTALSMPQNPLETPEQLDVLEQQIHALSRPLADHVTVLKLFNNPSTVKGYKTTRNN